VNSEEPGSQLSENGINVVRRFDYERSMFKTSQAEFVKYLKNKMNKQPLNELKISLKNIIFDEKV
jgi:hypothetical protein